MWEREKRTENEQKWNFVEFVCSCGCIGLVNEEDIFWIVNVDDTNGSSDVMIKSTASLFGKENLLRGNWIDLPHYHNNSLTQTGDMGLKQRICVGNTVTWCSTDNSSPDFRLVGGGNFSPSQQLSQPPGMILLVLFTLMLVGWKHSTSDTVSRVSPHQQYPNAFTVL